jgi:hypothetical protein
MQTAVTQTRPLLQSELRVQDSPLPLGASGAAVLLSSLPHPVATATATTTETATDPKVQVLMSDPLVIKGRELRERGARRISIRAT